MSLPAVIGFTALGVICLGSLVLTLGLLRRVVPALERAERLLAADPMSPDSGLQIGSTVPEFSVVDAVGRELSRDDLIGTGPTAFLFIADGCPSCGELTNQLQHEAWPSPHPLIVVTDEPTTWATQASSIQLVYQVGNAASEAFRQTALPQAFVVSGDRVVIGRVFPRSVLDISHLVHAVLRPAGDLTDATPHRHQDVQFRSD